MISWYVFDCWTSLSITFLSHLYPWIFLPFHHQTPPCSAQIQSYKIKTCWAQDNKLYCPTIHSMQHWIWNVNFHVRNREYSHLPGDQFEITSDPKLNCDSRALLPADLESYQNSFKMTVLFDIFNIFEICVVISFGRLQAWYNPILSCKSNTCKTRPHLVYADILECNVLDS